MVNYFYHMKNLPQMASFSLCNTLCGRIKGSHRATNLIMLSQQSNQGIIQIMPGKVAFSYPPFDLEVVVMENFNSLYSGPCNFY